MRRLIYPLMFVLAVSIIGIVSAQQQGAGQRGPGPQGQPPPQIDPETMIQRTLERALEQLKLSEEESAVLKPKIEVIIRTRMEQSQKMRDLVDSLREAVDAKNTEGIKSKLAEIKSKRKEHRAKVEALEEQLIELLTPEQEAILTVSGIVNSDGFGFFGFFRGPRPQGSQPQRQGGPPPAR